MYDNSFKLPSKKDLNRPMFNGVVRLGKQEPIKDMELVNLTFACSDDGSVSAKHNGLVIIPSRHSSIEPGEVWACSIDINGLTGGYEAVGIRCIKSVPKDVFIDSELDETEETETEVSEDSKKTRLEMLEDAVRKLTDNVTSLSEFNRQLCEEVKCIPEMKLLIDQLESELDAERAIVESMEESGGYADMLALKKRMAEMQEALDSKDLENEILREILRKNGLGDDPKAVPKIRSKIITCLTGPSRIYCRLLSDGRYSVRFNPLEGQLYFTPNEVGTVECRNQEVYIPGLAAYSGFQYVRDLSAVAEGEDVTIQL